MSQQDIDNNRFYAVMSYLWILCFVPLIWRRDSEFATYHAKQGVVLLIAEFFGMMTGWIPLVGFFLSGFIGFILAIFTLFGIINAIDGKYWEMPVIGKYAKKIRV
jgi:uncharacterized membrane protein